MRLRVLHWMPSAVLSAGSAVLVTVPARGQPTPVVLSGTGTYTENFNNIGAASPAGWGVYTGATSSSLGTQTTYNAPNTLWSATAGQFANYAASTGLTSTATTAEQNTSNNRALGVRQTGTFGDPGAAFSFRFTTTGTTVSSIAIDLMMLSVQTRSTAYTLQFGVGLSPTSWTTLGTYTDPGAFGSTPFSFNSGLSALSNQSDAWFRVVALSASTGAGSRDTVAVDNFAIAYSPAVAARVWTGTGGGGTWANGQQGNFDAGGGAYVNSLTTPVNFEGTGETVTLSGAVQAGPLSFAPSAGNYTLGGAGTLELGGSGDVAVAAGTTTTVSAQLVGAANAGLTKAGAGTLTLTNAANSFTGAVAVNGGVLSVSADGQLGAAANAVALGGGTLQTTASFSTARGITGAGTVDVAAGTTLTASGTVNAAGGLTLSNTGTLALTGAAPAVGGLTFTQAGTLNASANGLTLNGNLTAANTAGMATVTGATALGGTARTFNVAAGGTLAVGDLSYNSAGALRVNATGGGTLRLNGALTNAGAGTSGFAIGTAGTTGPTVQIGTNTALGTAQTFLNSGTIQATSNLTGANALGIGVSIGSRSTAPAAFAGQNITFNGGGTTTGTANNFFLGGATATQVNVNNVTTLGGTVTQSGTTGAGGISVGGTGNLVIAGSATGVTEATTLVAGSGVTFTLDATAGGTNGTWGAAVTASSGTTVAGSGAVGGNLTVAGTVAPSGTSGSLVGTLTNTGTGLTTAFSGGGTFAFDMVNGNVGPAGTSYDTIAAQALSLTGVTSANRFNVVLRSLSGPTTPGSISSANFDTAAGHTYTLVSTVGGVTGFTGGDQFAIDTTNFLVNGSQLSSSLFSVALSGNDLVLVYAVSPIPEPGTVLAVAAAGLGLARVVRRRRA